MVAKVVKKGTEMEVVADRHGRSIRAFVLRAHDYEDSEHGDGVVTRQIPLTSIRVLETFVVDGVAPKLVRARAVARARELVKEKGYDFKEE